MRRWAVIGVILLAGAMAPGGAARADRIVTATGARGDVTVETVRGGAVVGRDGDGRAVRVDLAGVTQIAVDGATAFDRAERLRAAGKWEAASAAYEQALRDTNDAGLRRLVMARSIGPLDELGRWDEAVGRFLEVAQGDPSAGTFELAPTRMPEAGSKMLAESAGAIEKTLQVAPFATDTAAARRLRGLLLGVYNQMDDPRAAAVARQLEASDAAVAAGPATASAGTQPAVDGVAQAAELAVANGRYDDALRIATEGLKTAEGSTAARLRLARAAALTKQGKVEDAVAELLKVPVFEPKTAQAPAALLRAGDLESKLGHAGAARRLYEQIVAKYAASTEAAEAQKRLARKDD